MVDIIRQIIKVHKEVEVVSAIDNIHVDHKTQEDNKEKTILTVTNNVINAETNTIRIIYNLARQKIKFVRNVPNEVILQTFADLQMLIILGTREDEQQEEIETECLETENDPVAFA